LSLDLVCFALTQLAALPMVAGAQDADRQDFVCINRRRTNAVANSRCSKRLTASNMSPG
jgi:hypothetical protein